jgi:hypothetical protein
MKNRIKELYLDYFNNFLTIACFAEYHQLSEEKARRILFIGRKLNDRKGKHNEYQ